MTFHQVKKKKEKTSIFSNAAINFQLTFVFFIVKHQAYNFLALSSHQRRQYWEDLISEN